MPLEGDSGPPSWYAWVDPLTIWLLAHEQKPPNDASENIVSAAVALLDISGFTALAEELAKDGPIGAERLKEILDRCFGILTTLVYATGGLVLKYPGDAALALWIADEGGGIAEAVRRAGECCLDAVGQIAALTLTTTRARRLELRAGVTAGEVRVMRVGGIDARWESLVGGTPLGQLEAVSSRARSGEVVLTTDAWRLVEHQSKATRIDSLCHRLDRIDRPPGPGPASGLPVPRLTPQIEAALRAYIPDAVLAHLNVGQTDWLAAFRPVTAMFVSLTGFDHEAEDALQRLHGAIACVQAAATRYGGSLNQSLVDDKGTVLVLGWGLALHAHEDDAARAVEAALSVHSELSTLGCRAAIGLATGRVFTGIRGNEQRKEYAMIGEVVILAARLMQGVSDGIWCDDKTRAGARQRILFEKLPAVRLKGKSPPVSVYRPLRRKAPATGDDLVDRQSEMQFLLARLRTLESGESSGTVMIEGEPGIGKSRSIVSLLRYTQTSNVRSIVARGDPVERSSSYHAWRSVLPRLLDLDRETTPEAQRRRILSLLESKPALAGHAALLNDVLQLGLAETETTSQMTPQGRAEMARELLLHLVETGTRHMPTLVVLEDAHWFDSPSWAFADALARRVRPLMIVGAMRPVLAHETTLDCRRFLERSDVTRLPLDALAHDDAVALANQCVGADELPHELSELLWRKAAGHPFYTEQLILALRDDGVIRVESGECSLVARPDALESLTLPETVQGVVTTRIDRLTPSQQVALRIASVIGTEFTLQSLHDAFPTPVTRDALKADVDGMVALSLLVATAGEPVPAYGFKHAITRQVTYDLLPFAQRRELHTAVARRLEAARSPLNHALLAHHWTEAGVPAKAFEYLVLAGEEAARSDANPEAGHFFTQALAIDLGGAGLSEDEVALRRARCHRRRGEVLWTLGAIDKVPDEVRSSFTLLRRPRRWVRGRNRLLLEQTVIQGLHLVAPRALEVPDPARKQQFLEASKTAGLLARFRTTPVDEIGLLAASLLSLNLAERGGSANVLSLGMLGYTASTLGLRRVSRAYFDRARVKAFELNELSEYAYALLYEAIPTFGAGEHARGVALLTDGVQMAQQIGDRRAAARLLSLRACLNAYTQSAPVDTILKHVFEPLDTLSDQPAVDQVYSLMMMGTLAALLMRPADAKRRIAPLMERMERSLNGSTDDAVAMMFSAHAWLYARYGESEEACRAADRAMSWVYAKPRSVLPSAYGVFQGPIEAYFGAYQRAQAGTAPRDPAARKARRAVRAFRRFARRYPIYQSRSLYLEGRLASLEHRQNVAKRLWARALVVAQRFEIPSDEALARIELAKITDRASVERHEHLTRARALLTPCGAPYYLDLLVAAEAPIQS